MLLRKPFLLSIFISLLFSGLVTAVEIPAENLLVPANLKGVRLFHGKKGFAVVRNNKVFPVGPENMDKPLRGLTSEKLDFLLGLKTEIEIGGESYTLNKFSPKQAKASKAEDQQVIQLSVEEAEEIFEKISTSSYIRIFQYSNGEYGLHFGIRLLGGGPFHIKGDGNWAKIGNFAVYAAGTLVIGKIEYGLIICFNPFVGKVVGGALSGAFSSLRSEAPVSANDVLASAGSGALEGLAGWGIGAFFKWRDAKAAAKAAAEAMAEAMAKGATEAAAKAAAEAAAKAAMEDAAKSAARAVAKVAAEGAVEGAFGALRSPEPVSAEKLLTSAARGAASGVAFYGVGKGVGKVIDKISGLFEKPAQNVAQGLEGVVEASANSSNVEVAASSVVGQVVAAQGVHGLSA